MINIATYAYLICFYSSNQADLAKHPIEDLPLILVVHVEINSQKEVKSSI